VALRCRPLLAHADHLFTTGDIELRDSESEWQAVSDALGVAAPRLLLIRQVHGAEVAVVRPGWSGEWLRPEADAIVSDDPASAIGVRVADCAPILIADRRRRAVGAAHAGWRGTVQRAAPAAIDAMRREFGSDPADLIAAIGPCLGACCGEVGEEVVEAFRAAGHSADAVARWFGPGPTSRPYLDLARANADQLIGAGVPAGSVYVSGLCTRTHSDLLHSYRARGTQAGRMVGGIKARSKELGARS
jgi:YfiH family protein